MRSWTRRLAARARLRRPRTAFVLSGGGNLGAVQVGMLRALVEAGIRPDVIVGCSVGAINGAGFAAEPDERGVARLERIWGRIADGDPDLMPSPKLMPIVAQLARKGDALHDPARLAELLDDELVTKTFAGLRIPFTCVATDLATADEHWFDDGRLVPALLASAALPAVYPAFEYRSHQYIDGGVLNEIHTERAVALGATELYILHVGHLEGRTLDVQRPFDAAIRAYWTARRFRLEDDLRRVPASCTVHRLPAGSDPRLRFDDFSQGAELAELAYAASAEYLRTGRAPAPVSGPVSAPEPGEVDQHEAFDDAAAGDEADEGSASDAPAPLPPDGADGAGAGRGSASTTDPDGAEPAIDATEGEPASLVDRLPRSLLRRSGAEADGDPEQSPSGR